MIATVDTDRERLPPVALKLLEDALTDEAAALIFCDWLEDHDRHLALEAWRWTLANEREPSNDNNRKSVVVGYTKPTPWGWYLARTTNDPDDLTGLANEPIGSRWRWFIDEISAWEWILVEWKRWKEWVV